METPAGKPETIALFALNATRDFGARVAQHLGVALAAHEEREFEDGEHKARPLEPVRGRDVYVVQSLYSDTNASVNDKLVRLLFFLGAVRDAGAARVTAVIPYLAYARKDARTQPRDPLTTRYVAQLIEAVGTDRAVALDVHNPVAFQNAFRIHAEHLDTARLFARHLAPRVANRTRVVVVSPDPGGFKRAERLRQALARLMGRDVELAFMEKARAKGVLTTGRLVGDVAGGAVIIIDDIIATGGTLAAAARACREHGAVSVLMAATHGLFIAPAGRVLAEDAIERVIVTDSVPPFRLDPELVARKVEVLSVAPLLGEAIARLHRDGSLVELLAP
jgi:ribose-phosphate pyrophosphokinase